MGSFWKCFKLSAQVDIPTLFIKYLAFHGIGPMNDSFVFTKLVTNNISNECEYVEQYNICSVNILKSYLFWQ